MKLDPRRRVDDGEVRHDGQGFHVTSGGAAIYYNAKDAQANDTFTVMANFRQTKKNVGPRRRTARRSACSPAATNLDDPAKQTYFYFLVRQDGKFLINHRAGQRSPQARRLDARTRRSRSSTTSRTRATISTIKRGPTRVRFLVNNTQVHAISRKEIIDVSGQTGFRVNHNLDVHIGNFMAMKGK